MADPKLTGFVIRPEARAPLKAVFDSATLADDRLDAAELERAAISPDLLETLAPNGEIDLVGAQTLSTLDALTPWPGQAGPAQSSKPDAAVLARLQARAQDATEKGEVKAAFSSFAAVARLAGADGKSELAAAASKAAADLLASSPTIPVRLRAQYQEGRLALASAGIDDAMLDSFVLLLSGRGSDEQAALTNVALVPQLLALVKAHPSVHPIGKPAEIALWVLALGATNVRARGLTENVVDTAQRALAADLPFATVLLPLVLFCVDADARVDTELRDEALAFLVANRKDLDAAVDVLNRIGIGKGADRAGGLRLARTLVAASPGGNEAMIGEIAGELAKEGKAAIAAANAAFETSGATGQQFLTAVSMVLNHEPRPTTMAQAFIAAGALASGPAVHFVSDYLGSRDNANHVFDRSHAMQVLAWLGVDLTTLTRETFARAVAEAINSKADGTNAVYNLGKVGAIINYVHERDNEMTGTDTLRLGLAATLSARAAYILIAGADKSALFTSTYQALLDRFVRDAPDGDLPALLARVDPEREQSYTFFAQLLSYRQLDVLQSGAPVLATLIADDLVAGRHFRSDTDVIRIQPFVRATFGTLAAPVRERLEKALVESASQAPSGNPARATALRFVLRDLYQSGAPLSDEARSVAAALPAIAPVGVPSRQWLADGALTARLFFYPDEHSIDQARAALTANGFKRNDAYAKAQDLRAGKDTVFERKQGGIIQRVILSMDADEQTKRAAVLDPRIDFIAHRGHSFHLEETFPVVGKLGDGPTKLIIGGSCGSLAGMTSAEFLATYGEHLFLADADTGEGAVNNAVLLKIMDGVANGKTSWDQMGLEALAKARGIVSPDDPVFAVARYGRALAAAHGL